MNRDIQVKVMLDADEYVAFRHLCEAEGLSQSSKARMLIKEAVRMHALPLRDGDSGSDETGQD